MPITNSNIENRLRKIEKRKGQTILPNYIDEIRLSEALMFGKYAIKGKTYHIDDSQDGEALITSQDLLDKWKKKLGQQQYHILVNKLNDKGSKSVEEFNKETIKKLEVEKQVKSFKEAKPSKDKKNTLNHRHELEDLKRVTAVDEAE